MSGWKAGTVALLVGGAILLTGWLVSRPSSGPDGPGPDVTAAPTDVDPDVSLACVPGLSAACREAAGVLGVGYREWEAGEPLPDRGVVVAPASSFAGLGVEPGPVVAESPIVIAGWRTHRQPLELICGTVDPACIADSLDRSWVDLGGSPSWGDFKLGLSDPTSSEPGILAWSLLEPALAGDVDAFRRSLRVVADDDAELMEEVVLFSSRADFVVTTEVAVMGQFRNAIDRQAGRIEIVYPDSGPWVEFSVVGVGRGADSLIERLTGDEAVGAAFTRTGLRPVGGAVGPLPDGMGTAGAKTPSPDEAARGTLIAAWEEYR